MNRATNIGLIAFSFAMALAMASAESTIAPSIRQGRVATDDTPSTHSTGIPGASWLLQIAAAEI